MRRFCSADGVVVTFDGNTVTVARPDCVEPVTLVAGTMGQTKRLEPNGYIEVFGARADMAFQLGDVRVNGASAVRLTVRRDNGRVQSVGFTEDAVETAAAGA